MAKKWTNVAIGDLAEVDAEYIHRAYLDPDEHWNGWACPWFEKDEVMRMAAWLNDLCGETISYDEETDTFTVTDGYDISECVSGSDVDGMHLYPIGNGLWIWSEV